MLILDASAAVDIVVRSPQTSVLLRLIESERLFAPHLMYTEAISAVGRLERAQVLTADQASTAIAELIRLPVRTVWSPDWVTMSWERRDWLRFSDAIYVAAAERLGAQLLTTDQRMARALADRKIEVLLV